MADNYQMREILDKLDEGVKSLFESEKYAEYLRVMSRFHNYSLRNTLLIFAQKPDSKRVAGYNSWKNNFNRQVIKGEHGIKILAPIPYNETKETEKLDPITKQPVIDENGQPVMETLTRMAARFKTVSVFDISQTIGDPLPELAETLTGDVEWYELFMDALRAVSPLPIVFENLPPGTDGLCHFGDRIAIREGMSEVQTVAAAIHELAHSKVHDRNSIAGEYVEQTKREGEITAESIAFVVAQRFNIETGANSFGYIGSYLRDKDAKELQNSLDVIRNAASELIDGIEAQYRALAKERGIDLNAAVPAKTQETPASEMRLEDVLNNREEMIRRIMGCIVKDDPAFPVRALESIENDYRAAPIEGLRESYFFYFPNDPPAVAPEADEMSAEQNYNMIDGIINNEPIKREEEPESEPRKDDEVRERLAALSQAETLDAKYNLAFTVLAHALCANAELLAVAETGAGWQPERDARRCSTAAITTRSSAHTARSFRTCLPTSQ
jgi:hypothetical protein